jgi:hypothetical protein
LNDFCAKRNRHISSSPKTLIATHYFRATPHQKHHAMRCFFINHLEIKTPFCLKAFCQQLAQPAGTGFAYEKIRINDDPPFLLPI